LKVLHVVGARPNFVKTAPIMAEMAIHPDRFEQALVHTGQHYDDNMSRVFFEELGLPRPDHDLGVGSGTHAEQTARVMLAFEPLVQAWRPDLVLVVGDVNSTLACALVCAKLGIAVGHVEAGLRSFDRTMPEEFNRLLTDQIADLLFTPSRDADANLLREGIPPTRIHFVGNVMIDTLVRLLPRAERSPIRTELGLQARGYVLVTLHRPSNVDDPATLRAILLALSDVARACPVVFPVHPRTRKRMMESGLEAPPSASGGLRLLEPLGYPDFLALMRQAALVLTDSGGIQEETTYLGIPCLTARPNTERPVTVEVGTNRLVQSERGALVAAVRDALGGPRPTHRVPELWDGRAARRIVEVLHRLQPDVTARREGRAW
jgi:UDP-N-acetylglucosamine 2-epimerase (non-hydrolysing)